MITIWEYSHQTTRGELRLCCWCGICRKESSWNLPGVATTVLDIAVYSVWQPLHQWWEVAINVVTAINRRNCSLVHYAVQVNVFLPAGKPYPFNLWRIIYIRWGEGERESGGKVRVEVERNWHVNITQNGQMLNLNIHHMTFFSRRSQLSLES